jgi:hypothetical protein
MRMKRTTGRRSTSAYASTPATFTATSARPLVTASRGAARASAAAGSPATATSAQNGVSLSADSLLVQTIAEQMAQFAVGLTTAQRSCDATQLLLVEKLEAQNKLITENRKAASAESKALSQALQQQFTRSDPDFVWRSRGHEAQHIYNCTTLNNYIEISTALESDDPEEAKALVRKGTKAIILRNKCIKLADASQAGWGLVDEYLSHKLADDDDDDKWIRKCETLALEKKRRRLDDSTGNKRGRGAGKGPGKGKNASPATETAAAASATPALPTLDPFTLALLQSSMQALIPSPVNTAKAPPKKLGPCFVCQGDHLQNDCPYVKGQRAAYQQHLAAQLATAPGNAKN